MSLEDFPTNHKLSEEELEEIARLFKYDLPDSPIDLEESFKQAQSFEYMEDVFTDMLDRSLEYTIDVAELEKYVRENQGDFDENREEIDSRRTRKHDATIDSINIYRRICQKNGLSTDWFNWEENRREKYGKFALLITLNRFRNEIVYFQTQKYLDFLHDKIPEDSLEVDYDSLKEGKTDIEIMIIEYVQILSRALNEDREMNEEEGEQIKSISSKLQKDEKSILGAFMEIYQKRYQ